MAISANAQGQVSDNSGVVSASGSNSSSTGGPVQVTADKATTPVTEEQFQAEQQQQTPPEGENAGTPAEDEAPKDPATEEASSAGDAEPKADASTEAKDLPEDFTPFAGTDDELRAVLKEAGGIYADPRYEAAAFEYERTGGITDATRDKLALDYGVDRGVVDSVIEGQIARRNSATATKAAQDAATEAQLQQQAADVKSVVDGDYDDFMDWAGKGGLSVAQRETYNRLLDSDVAAAKELLSQYNTMWKAAGFGRQPRDLTHEAAGGGDGAVTQVQGYSSQAEQQKAIADPRYKKDAAYRKEVQDRIAASRYS